MLLSLPFPIKAYVDNSYITTDPGITECYIVAVTCIRNRPHLFHCHLKGGALFSRLPVWAFSSKTARCNSITPQALEPWGVIGDKTQITVIDYFKDYWPYVGKLREWGRYLFSFEPLGGGFSEDPEQSKTLHLIALDTGAFAILPNNELLWEDKHFATEKTTQKLKRNQVYFYANG